MGSAEKCGSILGDGEHSSARDILKYVVVLYFVTGCSIDLANSLEDALGDVGSGSGLKGTLMVVISPVNEPVVLYPYRIGNPVMFSFKR